MLYEQERNGSEGTNLESEPDTTFYIENDHMGESSFQFFLSHHLVELIRFYLETLGQTAFVSGNQFMHMQKGDNQANLAPDVYVLPDERLADDAVRSWRMWEHNGKGPCLAVELVADEAEEARKDYQMELLSKYQRMGVKELIRYDPYGVGRRLSNEKRQLLTHFVRNEEGLLQVKPLIHPWKVRSVVYGFWMVHEPPRSLRLAIGEMGEIPFLSRTEALLRRAELEARRAEEESRRAEEESRRAEEESRRAEEESRRAEQAESQLAEAQAEIARLRAASI